MFERFTERARQVAVLAQDEARQAGNSSIEMAHLLGGLLREDEGIAAAILANLDVKLEAVRAFYPTREDADLPENVQIPFEPTAKKCLELALRETLSLGHNYIGTEHILLALVRQGFFEHDDMRVSSEAVRAEVISLLSGRARTARTDPTGKEMLVEDSAELIEKLDRLSALQMELARRGFFSSVTTYRVNYDDRRVAPEGDKPLHSLSGWNARCNVVYERVDRPAMDVLTGLAVEHGCFVEWSQKHGVTFYPRRADEIESRRVMVVS